MEESGAMQPMHDRGLRVVVAGGGVAGLETLLALRVLAGDLVKLHLISPGENFVYRPLEVVEPFDARAMVRVPWGRILRDRGIPNATTRSQEPTRVRPSARQRRSLRPSLIHQLGIGARIRPD